MSAAELTRTTLSESKNRVEKLKFIFGSTLSEIQIPHKASISQTTTLKQKKSKRKKKKNGEQPNANKCKYTHLRFLVRMEKFSAYSDD